MYKRALRLATTVAALTFLASCGGDSTSPSGLTAAFVSGIWDVNATGCINGDLPVRLSASSDGALTSAINAWTNDESLGFFRPLDGTVDLGTGAAEFHMWDTGSHDGALLFSGTLHADGLLTGTLTDPMPGYGSVFHFSGGPICTAPVTGHHR
jgi:hypothetical protein